MSARMSTNTGVAPRSTKALAVETNVNEGMITSSPGLDACEQRRHLQRAVHEWVSRTLAGPSCASSQSEQRAVNGPLPDRCALSIASRM